MDKFTRNNNERKNYRFNVGRLVQVIQAAAIAGFALRCVAAGSLYATVSITEDERAMLSKQGFVMELDK